MWMLHCLSKAQGWWGGGGWRLQQQTFSLPLLYRRGAQHCSDGFIKHCLEASLRKCWAFEIFHCAWGKQRHSYRAASHSSRSTAPSWLHNKSQAFHLIKVQGLPQTQPTISPLPHTDLFCHGKALWVGDGSQLLLLQLFNRVLVIPQIEFGAHEDDGGVGTVVPHFRVPLKRTNKKWCLLCGGRVPWRPWNTTPEGSQSFPFRQLEQTGAPRSHQGRIRKGHITVSEANSCFHILKKCSPLRAVFSSHTRRALSPPCQWRHLLVQLSCLRTWNTPNSHRARAEGWLVQGTRAINPMFTCICFYTLLFQTVLKGKLLFVISAPCWLNTLKLLLSVHQGTIRT